MPALRRLSLPRLATVIAPRRRPSRSPVDGELARIVQAVEAAQQIARPLVRPGCLTRAVTLYWLLSRAGADVELCFGVGDVGGIHAGHSWLVKDGEVFLEAVDPLAGMVRELVA